MEEFPPRFQGQFSRSRQDRPEAKAPRAFYRWGEARYISTRYHRRDYRYQRLPCQTAGTPRLTFVTEQLEELAALSIAELKSKWRQLHESEPPKRLSRELLTRAIAYKMQEKAHGGLKTATKRKLTAMVTEYEQRGKISRPSKPLVKPGTRLVRQWHGKTHSVTVFDRGFEYDGGHYRSLSATAREITRLQAPFNNGTELLYVIESATNDIGEQKAPLDSGEQLAGHWSDLQLSEIKAIITRSITRIEVHEDLLDIHIDPHGLHHILKESIAQIPPARLKNRTLTPLPLADHH